jgi:hypothetical protein
MWLRPPAPADESRKTDDAGMRGAVGEQATAAMGKPRLRTRVGAVVTDRTARGAGLRTGLREPRQVQSRLVATHSRPSP